MPVVDDIIDLLSPGATYLEVWWPEGSLFSDLSATTPSTGSGAVRCYRSQDGEDLLFRNDDTHPGNVPTRGAFPNGAPGVFFTLEPSGPRIFSTDNVDLTGSDDGLLFILGVSRGGIDNAFPARHYGVASGPIDAFGQHWGEEGDTHSNARTEGPSASVGVAYYDKPTGYHVTTSYHRGGGSPLTLIRMDSTEYERTTTSVGSGGYGNGPIYLGCLGGDKSFGMFGPYIVRRGALPSDEVLEEVEALVLSYGTDPYDPGGEPIVVEAPATSFTLTLPAPSLLRHRVMQVPATSYSLTLPAPSILRHRILAVPLTAYSLSLPAPSLHRRQVVSVPLTAYALALPAPQLLTRRVIAVPLTSYALGLPAPAFLRHMVLPVPVTDYTLTLPAPALVQAGTIKVPLTEYTLGLPAPQLLRHLILDVPLTSYGLTLLAPALIKGQSIAVPLTEYSLALPAPALLRHLLIAVPLTSYVLALPVPLIISPHSSRRRAADPGDSATGGLFTIRAPGALVSDGITGGTIERG